jgi:hypothetical protein
MEDIKCEQDSIKWVTNNTPFLINTAKKCKHQCINPFSSFNAFKKVTEYLGKRLWELLNNKNNMKYEIKAELLEKIVEKQDEIIAFYGKHLNGAAVFLNVHNYKPSDKDIETGKRLRSELASLKSQLLEQKCHNIYEKVKESWTPEQEDEPPKYPLSNRDFTMTDKVTTKELNDIDKAEEEKK